MELEDLAASGIVFGPVPSRRLGRSLGVNNIPPKICSYSCVYCQLGRTANIQVTRRRFYNPVDILRKAKSKYENAISQGENIDYITFVPDGEPTLDHRLGETLKLLQSIGPKVGVISNASLISEQSVRDDLARADWVSLKVDAIDKRTWKQINRPHKDLSLAAIQEGILEFANVFRGQLVTETMLVNGVNDTAKQLAQVADFIGRLHPAKAYVSVPTRPPAEKSVQIPSIDTLATAYHVLAEYVSVVEFLIEYEGNEFTFTGDAEENLLSIMSVHPMREDAVDEFLDKAGANKTLIRDLVQRGRLIKLEHAGRMFYMTPIPGRRR
jgi:wyosine [tRNA(Phe)-imidazoG37] synthetase (radical SAM superfamily)